VRNPDDCDAALTFAFEEASLRQATLTAVHAWHTPQTDISRAGQLSAAPEQQAVAAMTIDIDVRGFKLIDFER